MAELGKDRDLYIEGWTQTQLQIWREKIERLHVVRTGALHQSFSSQISAVGEGKVITMKFHRYGIYQALGVGRGYEKGNDGELKFLDPEYRHLHRLDEKRKVGPAWGGYVTSGKPRKPRDWYSKKLYMSVMAMKEDLARITGEEAASVICDALMDVRSSIV